MKERSNTNERSPSNDNVNQESPKVHLKKEIKLTNLATHSQNRRESLGSIPKSNSGSEEVKTRNKTLHKRYASMVKGANHNTLPRLKITTSPLDSK